MKKFPKKYEFKYPWREYQARVLNELDGHFDDHKLNVVAAPGSGKTVLGIEVMLRKNKPTVILAPTLAIRNQWADRLTELFVQQEKTPEWVSFDIKSPKLVTIITYQALHMAFKNAVNARSTTPEEDPDEELDDGQLNLFEPEAILPAAKAQQQLKKITAAGIQTLVLDEAHHLRSEWWETLKFFVAKIEGVETVSLTATPPYDVPPNEWKNYQELCGPIDIEVGVPELVAKADLCPHQDYVVLSRPTFLEKKLLDGFRSDVSEFMRSLYTNNELIQSISKLPALEDPEKHTEQILDNVPYYLAAASFMRATGQKLDKGALKILTGKKYISVPKFDEEGAEILLGHALYRDDFLQENYPELIAGLKKRLKSISAIERRQVQLRSTKSLQRLLVSSISKFDSINDIVRHESSNRRGGLRMVVLADYIRKEYLSEYESGEGQFNKIGVIPIFESIRRENKKSVNKIAVLTGTIMIIPTTCMSRAKEAAQSIGIKESNYRFRKLKHDRDYLVLSISGNNNHQKVALITELFETGEINIIVGTAALLGEGWDAPTLNSLILASYVGSYMFSNQMRGRAIRIDKSRPEKVASIWHLVAVNPDDQYGDTDYSIMRRRFRAFVGVSYDQPFIESGTDRLEMPKWRHLQNNPRREIGKYNAKVFGLSSQYERWREQWSNALKIAKDGKLAHELDVPKAQMPKNYVLFQTIESLIFASLITAFIYIEQIIFSLLGELRYSGEGAGGFLYILAISVVGVILFFGYKILRLVWYLFRNGSTKKHVKSITETITRSFYETGTIKTRPEQVLYRVGNNGSNSELKLYGGTPHEQQLVLDAFEQVIGKLNNPRYIVVRHSMISFLRIRRNDYHAVPDLLATRKKLALSFSRHWGEQVGSHKLIFTRNAGGRKLLLRARLKASSRAFIKRAERKEKWV